MSEGVHVVYDEHLRVDKGKREEKNNVLVGEDIFFNKRTRPLNLLIRKRKREIQIRVAFGVIHVCMVSGVFVMPISLT